MEFGVKTDVGMVRDNNQDAFYVSPDENFPLFIIADGMGGHKAGEIASNMAIDIIKDNLTRDLAKTSISDKEIKKIIENSIYEANRGIYIKSIENENFSGMGTTVVLAYIIKDKIFIGHVGDSRAYILRKDKLFQVTKDHSLVEELISNGSISKEEARNHPQRNVITRAVGTSADIKIDIIVEDKYKDDTLLLCTDGLTTMVDDDKIKDLLVNSENIQETCENLVKLSNARGGFDNITVIAIEI